jgi:SAM-dependent methyltransferase
VGAYYAEKLAGERLRRCYEVASPRVKRYLEAEVLHVLARIGAASRVLELGCGYGRVLERLAAVARLAVGIDTAAGSLRLAARGLGSVRAVRLCRMDAGRLAFPDRAFDAVVGIQNAVSAFGLDPRRLVEGALRVTRPGGRLLFSSYAAGFWEQRLAWFHAQAAEGLIGPIDPDATRDGVIVCRDGFAATTVGPEQWRGLTAGLPARIAVEEVDGSSLFCELVVG